LGYKLCCAVKMAVPEDTRTVRIHLADSEFRYNEDIPLDTNIGEWVRATRAAYRLEGGRLEVGDRAFAEVLTFRNTPNVELQFVGAVAQQPAQPQHESTEEELNRLFPDWRKDCDNWRLFGGCPQETLHVLMKQWFTNPKDAMKLQDIWDRHPRRWRGIIVVSFPY
jgi:hypothetical protein